MLTLGRDEHNKPQGRNRFAQTPKNQITENIDIEFSHELADDDDKEAIARAREADQRVKED